MLKSGTLPRRHLLAASAGLALSGCATPSHERTVLVNLAEGDRTETASPSSAASLATGADEFSRMTVPVRLNGLGPFEFVVDTGANRTVVADQLAAMLGLPDSGMADVHGIVGVESHRTSLVERLEADSLVARRIRAPNLPRDRMGADGLLGVDVLRNRMVTLDFVNRRLRIGAPSRNGPPQSSFDMRLAAASSPAASLGDPVVVSARYRFGQLIVVDCEIRGQRVTAFMDSGSQSTVANLSLRRLIAAGTSDQNVNPNRGRLLTPLLSATGQTSEGEVGPLPPLRIGGLTLTGLNVVFADLHVFDLWRLQNSPAILIGIDVMRRFNALQLDFAGRQVLFYPAGPLPRFR